MTSGCWTRRKSCWLLWALGGFPLPRPRSMTSGSPSPPRWPTSISNAYIKSPTARNHDGFSAGSYKDLTRVAWLNPAMWAELFLENRENLLFELDTLIRSLEQYREAIQEDDFAALCQLLEEGRRIKEEVDGT